MVPSNMRHTEQNDYSAQGTVVQEMRTVARNYGIPIVTVTQGTRNAEDPQQELNNALLADSHRKVRYSDYIYLVRMRRDQDILSGEVSEDLKDNENIDLEYFGDEQQDFIPFEIKITKAKDGTKDQRLYHVFNERNLRIYENAKKLYKENQESTNLTKDLENKIQLLDVEAFDSDGDQLIV